VRAVLWLAIAGLLALVIAALTGSAPLAVVVMALAGAGIVQVVRDWRHERAVLPAGRETGPAPPQPSPQAPDTGLSPDDFAPDISGHPDGPSSDARADQM